MKTQTFGMCKKMFQPCTDLLRLIIYYKYAIYQSVNDYRAKRENGNVSDNPDTAFPEDGKVTWIKGTVKDDSYVYGVLENDGYYHYEVRYDEGFGDKKWMKEKDKKYLDRLEKEGTLEKLEPEEFKKRQIQKEEIKIPEEELKDAYEKLKKHGDIVIPNLKTQTYGIHAETRQNKKAGTPRCKNNCGCSDYRNKRENGAFCDDPKREFPNDGLCTWIKGEEKDNGNVYGVMNKDGNYEYEYRYDE